MDRTPEGRAAWRRRELREMRAPAPRTAAAPGVPHAQVPKPNLLLEQMVPLAPLAPLAPVAPAAPLAPLAPPAPPAPKAQQVFRGAAASAVALRRAGAALR